MVNLSSAQLWLAYGETSGSENDVETSEDDGDTKSDASEKLESLPDVPMNAEINEESDDEG